MYPPALLWIYRKMRCPVSMQISVCDLLDLLWISEFRNNRERSISCDSEGPNFFLRETIFWRGNKTPTWTSHRLKSIKSMIWILKHENDDEKTYENLYYLCLNLQYKGCCVWVYVHVSTIDLALRLDSYYSIKYMIVTRTLVLHTNVIDIS